MSPQLVVKVFGNAGEDTCELAKAGYLFGFEDRIVVVEGQRVNSYDELIQLASRDSYKNKDYIEVVLLPAIAGG